jgi:hypothetical protein
LYTNYPIWISHSDSRYPKLVREIWVTPSGIWIIYITQYFQSSTEHQPSSWLCVRGPTTSQLPSSTTPYSTSLPLTPPIPRDRTACDRAWAAPQIPNPSEP